VTGAVVFISGWAGARSSRAPTRASEAEEAVVSVASQRALPMRNEREWFSS
jgi:hypothetical protein